MRIRMRIRMINQVRFEVTFGMYVTYGSVCGSAWYFGSYVDAHDAHTPTISCIFSGG